MAKFEVKGPIDMPVTKNKAARTIESYNINEFWEKYSEYENRKGCYVFGFKAPKGYKPVYVGKATRGFAQEIFTHSKLVKYQRALANQIKGKPVFFFVCENIKRGAINRREIDALETFLIQCGKIVNVSILNERKTKENSWSIDGVVGGGWPSCSAKEFKKIMGINSKNGGKV